MPAARLPIALLLLLLLAASSCRLRCTNAPDLRPLLGRVENPELEARLEQAPYALSRDDSAAIAARFGRLPGVDRVTVHHEWAYDYSYAFASVRLHLAEGREDDAYRDQALPVLQALQAAIEAEEARPDGLGPGAFVLFMTLREHGEGLTVRDSLRARKNPDQTAFSWEHVRPHTSPFVPEEP